MLPDKIEHCIVFMNYWDVSGVFWSFSKCKIKIPHLPADPSTNPNPTSHGIYCNYITVRHGTRIWFLTRLQKSNLESHVD